jgi:hypothetical protein
MLVDREQIPGIPEFNIKADESDEIDPSTKVEIFCIPAVGS